MSTGNHYFFGRNCSYVPNTIPYWFFESFWAESSVKIGGISKIQNNSRSVFNELISKTWRGCKKIGWFHKCHRRFSSERSFHDKVLFVSSTKLPLYAKGLSRTLGMLDTACKEIQGRKTLRQPKVTKKYVRQKNCCFRKVVGSVLILVIIFCSTVPDKNGWGFFGVLQHLVAPGKWIKFSRKCSTNALKSWSIRRDLERVTKKGKSL